MPGSWSRSRKSSSSAWKRAGLPQNHDRPPSAVHRLRFELCGQVPTMPGLRLALAQFDFPVGAVASNASRIAALIAEARDGHGADFVLFPELAVSGYPPEDLLLRPAFLAECERAVES